MPFKSLAQMRGAFSGKLGPEMKAHAQEWADATKNAKDLPEHVIPKKKKMAIIKKAVQKHTGKGGPLGTPFTEAAAPINLLKSGAPPTAKGIPRTAVNSLGNK
ncbi:MAG: hypothetical protein WC917_03720 [Bacilli bacterium]|jgi:hypothetical protein